MVCQRHGIFFFSGVSEFLSRCLVYADPSMAGGCMSFLSLSLSLFLSLSLSPCLDPSYPVLALEHKIGAFWK